MEDASNPQASASSSVTTTDTSAAPLFKKKAPRVRDLRQRPPAESSSTDTASAVDGSSLKARAKGPIRSTTATTRTISEVDSQPDLWDEYKDTGAAPPPFKKRALPDRDLRQLSDEPSPSNPATTSAAAAAEDDGLYKGLSAYKSHGPVARDDGSSSKIRAKGPIKPTATIRTTSVVDYQPDVCKDYKETGYCGFGDTCKFLHDRSDYVAGWQLALVPQSYSAGKRRDDVSLGILDAEGEDLLNEEDEEIPFACLICRQPFTEPVVTRCGHYFCMACAIKRYTKNPKCFACGKPTNGLFNAATKILERMERKREEKADTLRERRKAWGREEGEEQTSGELLEGVEIGD
ncbi:hypothetical protein CF327_g2684 [Tilletia walkeri]|nr:hypothetical protein CF327_g2684 [Tilletia walkeri]